MKFKGLILGDIRQQYKYGFYALYTLFTLVYIAVLRILPMQWKELCTTTLIFSDPVLIGLTVSYTQLTLPTILRV